MTGTASLAARLRRLERERAKAQPMTTEGGRSDPVPFGAYAGDPVGYAANVLRVGLTPDQATILRHLHVPPCWVNVPSGNDTGKSFLAACAVSYWYDSFDPGVVYQIAPRYEHVVNVVWAQLRILRHRAGLRDEFIGPRAPEMYAGPDHLAKGITSAKGESFQGRHLGRKLFVIDEATGVAPMYFDVIPTMFDPEAGDAVLAIYNPTDTTSRMYQEDMRGQLDDEEEGQEKVWHRFPLSALNHPNVLADLRGEPRPIPGAVNLRMVSRWVRDWCEPVRDTDEVLATDVEWPPGAGKHYRPGPEFQARGMGLWPDTGTGVWGEALWQACLKGPEPAIDLEQLPEIGCDTATGKGSDFHAIHGRWHKVSVLHETANTMDPVRIFGRLKECAALLADLVNKARHVHRAPESPRRIPIKIDDDGTGGAIARFLRADGYTVAAVGAGTKAAADTLYPRKRDELWFQVSGKARKGLVHVGRLDKATQRRLKQQLLAPAWDLDGAGRRQVEPKEDTREKIGRSPDDADAFNLAYLEGPLWKAPEGVDRDPAPPRESLAAKRGMFGRTR